MAIFLEKKQAIVEDFKKHYRDMISIGYLNSYRYTEVDNLDPVHYLSICPNTKPSIQWLILHSSSDTLAETPLELYEQNYNDMLSYYEYFCNFTKQHGHENDQS